MLRSENKIKAIKSELFDKLKEEHAFWSYAPDSVSVDRLSDEQLIALTMRYLDLQEIRQLFSIFPTRKIKSAWINLLVPEGDFLYTLNRFFAWYYFKAKRPDSYLKSLQTRRLNATLSHISAEMPEA